ncbi:MAG: hypothetical protein HY951_15220, partial [Bacteroidia bacterium]|nr:hypothetical protein [Bacteroidia bacterium]
HIGGDDFVIITTPEKVRDICENIIQQFDKLIPALYDDDDRKKGYIISKNRKGRIESFPIMTISIGVVTNEKKIINHSIKIGEIGNELKRFAKTYKRSNYIIDGRKSDGSDIFTHDNEIIRNNGGFDFFKDPKDFEFILQDLQKFLKYQKEVGLVYVNINPIDTLAYNTKIRDEIFENTFRIFFESQQDIIRKKDIISIYNNEKNKIFIYLSPARSKIGITSANIEKILNRIELFVQNKIKKEPKEEFRANISMGYSLINFPFKCMDIL